MTFSLHPQLEKDTLLVGELPLCSLLLMNNRHFPWLILVPRRTGIREFFELSDEDALQAMQEWKLAARELQHLTHAHKMNIAALGNQVAQLHLHVIARFTQDAAWPNPVWNAGIDPLSYEDDALKHFHGRLRQAFDFSYHITKM